MDIMSQSYSCFSICPSSYAMLVKKYPEHLIKTVEFYETFSLKWEPVKNWMISDLMDEIVEREKVWSDNLGETRPLFEKGEAEKAIYYIPRWPLFIHLVASII